MTQEHDEYTTARTDVVRTRHMSGRADCLSAEAPGSQADADAVIQDCAYWLSESADVDKDSYSYGSNSVASVDLFVT